MRVTVLGHRGMLGHMVAKYLRAQGCQVLTLTQRFERSSPHAFLNELSETGPDWCVNCIGIGPRQATTREQLFEVNALLPEMCIEALPPSTGFIQASTDGVFDSSRSQRIFSEATDAQDDYGQSKRRAEAVIKGNHRYVIRCSIIGPELGRGHNLLNWFLSEDSSVKGYVNHFWNGITTLEWAKLAYRVMTKEVVCVGIFQPGIFPALTKYELLVLLGRVWGHSIKIIEVEAADSVVRTLLPNVPCPSMLDQLLELKAWVNVT